MKKHIEVRKYLLAAALLLAGTTWLLAADGPEVEKKKTYSKSYAVSGNEKVNINNQFGEVKITTWNKNEVKVDVTVTVKASSDEKAQALLDNITVDDSKTGEGVSFKTTIGKQDGKGERRNGKGESQSMEINYEVNMPAASPLNLENQFGKSYVPDMSGPIEITQKFGDLTAGNLPNIKDLHVEFGSATIESIGNCKVVIKFSKAEIKKMTGSIKGNFEFCEKVKLSLDNNVTDFNLNNSYSKIEIAVAGSFGGDFEIHTNFGEFKNSSSLSLKEDKDEDNDNHGVRFDKDFNGKSGNGACKVKIKSSFGTIKLI